MGVRERRLSGLPVYLIMFSVRNDTRFYVLAQTEKKIPFWPWTFQERSMFSPLFIASSQNGCFGWQKQSEAAPGVLPITWEEYHGHFPEPRAWFTKGLLITNTNLWQADLVSGWNEGLRLLSAENNNMYSPFSAFGFVNVRGQNKHNVWVVRKQIDYQVGALWSEKCWKCSHINLYGCILCRETCTCPDRMCASKATVVTSSQAVQSWAQLHGYNHILLVVTLPGTKSSF